MTASVWQDYLAQARWFSGKGLGGTIARIRPLPWYTAEGTWPAIRSEIADVAYGDTGEQYHLLVAYHPGGTPSLPGHVGSTDVPGLGPVEVVDAPRSPADMRVLIGALIAAPPPAMRWLDSDKVSPAAAISLFSGEQSNTTVVVGDALFKLFRKLEPGRNLDIDVLEALNHSGVTPELYGVLADAADPGPQDHDLGMFCQRMPGVVDGWAYATDACAAERDIAGEAESLGVALHEVHVRLADAFGTSQLSGDDLAATMIARFETAAVQVTELAQYAHALRLTLASPKSVHLTSQRVHGDFHLGQVLRSEAGWTIIDFEGEPLKSLAERRQFDSVWRDVAGMLRSFDYARSAHARPESEPARAWARSAREAFLAGYCGDRPAEAALLRAYELDKAIYEVVYEVRNRPNWAHIPWGAVQDEARRVSLNPPTPTNEEN